MSPTEHQLPATHPNLNETRRPSLLKIGGLVGPAALGSVIAVDLLSQITLWRKGSTEIIPGEADPASEMRWLAMPGLGQQNGRFIAERLDDILPGTIDYATLSERGISGRNIGQTLRDYYKGYYPADQQARQNVLLSSAGLPMFLMGVEWCRKHDIPVPAVDRIMAFGSPLNAKHTFMERQVRLAARYPYPGGMLSKLSIEIYQRYQQEKFQLATLGHTALSALKISYRDYSPALWSSVVRTLARESSPPGTFSGVITPQTTLWYFGDRNDPIVRAPEVPRDLDENFVKPYGARLISVDVTGDGHATIGPKTRAYISREFMPEAA